MFPCLVADIGGTNARFALVEKHTAIHELHHVKAFNCLDFSEFSDVLQAYLDFLVAAGATWPLSACIAVAGPVANNSVAMTNLQWRMDGDALAAQFSLQRCLMINDFVAQAMALPFLAAENLMPVKKGNPVSHGLKVIMGPGTGLGVASLAYSNRRWQALPGEGGHVNFAPRNALQIQLLEVLLREHAYVSNEWLMCGSGLVRLYHCLAQINDVAAAAIDHPARVLELGITHADELARQSLDVFCDVLGAAAANAALTCGAVGGVYLGGGILPRMREFLLASTFTDSFCSKGVMSQYVEVIPVQLVCHDNPALIGAAASLSVLLPGR